MRKKLLIPAISLSLLAVVLAAGCTGDDATGKLQFYANGEDFVRQGFVSKDGWSISFDHVYITLSDIAAYQTDPPYDPHEGASIDGKISAGLNNTYTIDLAEGDEDAPPIQVDEIAEVPVAQYNAISWKMARAESGVAAGHSLVIIGTAVKEEQSIDFTINVDEECDYYCGEYVGDERKGILTEGGTTDLEMTFHFDHIFGDGELAADDELNLAAVGFQPFADGADAGTVLNMTEMHLGHVGEGHCNCGCQ